MRLGGRRAGDASLADIEVIYRAHYPAFLRTAAAVLGDEDLGADAVHDGFVQAVRFRRSYRGEGSLEGWVWRTVVNAACRSRRRFATSRAGAEGALDRGADQDARDVDGRVRELVALLPDRQRLTVFLRYYADLDYDTIAQALDVSPGTVAAALSAAHATLRQALQEVPR
jgi:RNA polymerase sigma-70 factor (ECF subfamily)